MISGAFLLTVFLLAAAPGPSFMALISQSLRHGRIAGLITTAGTATGLVCWATVAAVGLAAVLQSSEIAYSALRLSGATYIFWLGLRSFTRKGGVPHTADDESRSGRHRRRLGRHRRRLMRQRRSGHGRIRSDPATMGRAYRVGLLTSLSNPKIMIVYISLIPQFLPAGGGAVKDVTLLTATQISVSTIWYIFIVLVIDAARRVLERPRVLRWIPKVSGVVLLYIGIRTALESNSSA